MLAVLYLILTIPNIILRTLSHKKSSTRVILGPRSYWDDTYLNHALLNLGPRSNWIKLNHDFAPHLKTQQFYTNLIAKLSYLFCSIFFIIYIVCSNYSLHYNLYSMYTILFISPLHLLHLPLSIIGWVMNSTSLRTFVVYYSVTLPYTLLSYCYDIMPAIFFYHSAYML